MGKDGDKRREAWPQAPWLITNWKDIFTIKGIKSLNIEDGKAKDLLVGEEVELEAEGLERGLLAQRQAQADGEEVQR